MKKSIAVFAIAVFAAAAVHAQQTEKPDPARVAYDEAHAYVLADIKSNGWANAADHLARYDQVLADFPDAPRDVMRQLQRGRVLSIYRSKDYAGAVTAGEAYLREYTDEVDYNCVNMCQYVGISLEQMGKLAEAQAAYERALADWPDVWQALRATIQWRLAGVLDKRGEKTAATAAYMTLVTNYAWYCHAKDESSVVWKAFDKVNPMLLSTEDYRAFLEAAIKATRATEENARFLGRVKSELEKIQ
jgi:tetratricopeptide (TPR) repeat protein